MRTTPITLPLAALAIAALSSCSDAPPPDPGFTLPDIVTKEVEYQGGGTQMLGFLAAPISASADDKVPGILVVHEWWGHNSYARDRAGQLAALGFVAMAVDMFGEGKTADHPDNAREFATAAMSEPEATRARFEAAMDVLRDDPRVDLSRIAAIGYCFGGAIVLNMARAGVDDLRAVVSFHGSLATAQPAQPGAVKAAILVCHGADDPFIPEDHVAAFKQEMEAAEADLTFKAYPGASHSFTSPEADELAERFDMPIGYHEQADRKSWQDMQDFFAEHLATP
jgi:dienelactone hydrolase